MTDFTVMGIDRPAWCWYAAAVVLLQDRDRPRAAVMDDLAQVVSYLEHRQAGAIRGSTLTRIADLCRTSEDRDLRQAGVQFDVLHPDITRVLRRSPEARAMGLGGSTRRSRRALRNTTPLGADR